MGLNKVLAGFLFLLLVVVGVELAYYLRLERLVDKKTTETVSVQREKPAEKKTIVFQKQQIEFVSGASLNLPDKNKPMPNRVGSLRGTIVKVDPEGLTIKIGREERFYLFRSRVYLFWRNNPQKTIGLGDLKTGQETEFSTRLNDQKEPAITVLIVED